MPLKCTDCDVQYQAVSIGDETIHIYGITEEPGTRAFMFRCPKCKLLTVWTSEEYRKETNVRL